MAENLNKAAGSESFASKFGAIMSMTGMAIGLGYHHLSLRRDGGSHSESYEPEELR